MQKLISYSIISLFLFSFLSCSCNEDEVQPEQDEVVEEINAQNLECDNLEELVNIEETFAAEIQIISDENADCQERKDAAQKLSDFIDNNEGCINLAIEVLVETDEEKETIRDGLTAQKALLDLLLLVPCF